MRRVFLDANVLLDYLLARQPWDAQAAPLWTAIVEGSVTACTGVNTVLNVAYVARKNFDVQRMRVALRGLMDLMEIAGVEEAALRSALTSAITDYEDAVQHECALVAGAKCIITRDPKDFQNSSLPVFLPADFIAQHLTSTP